MAKPFHGQAGSSCHIHLSLWRGGKNVLEKDGELFRCFLGGWMAHLPEMMAFYAPTVNSYKRYVDASWAPTRIAWSYDNRTAGFRVVGEGRACASSAAFPAPTATLPRLRRRARVGPGWNQEQARSSRMLRRRCLRRAAPAGGSAHARRSGGAVSKSAFAKSALGDAVVEHYSHFFRTEVAAFDGAVTDWERSRYFERI